MTHNNGLDLCVSVCVCISVCHGILQLLTDNDFDNVKGKNWVAFSLRVKRSKDQESTGHGFVAVLVVRQREKGGRCKETASTVW